MNKHLLRRLIFDALNFAVILGLVLYAGLGGGEDSTPDVARLAGIFLLLALLGVPFSVFLNISGKRSLGELLFCSPEKSAAATDHSLLRSAWGWQLLISFLVLLIAAGRQTEFSVIELFDRDGFSSARNLFHELARPDWRLLPIAILKVIETIFIAFLATVFALPVAFVLSFVAAKNIMRGPVSFLVYSALRTFLNLVRSVEPIIWAIIFAVWVGVGPFAGMLALMVQSIASLTKQYSEIVEGVSDGPIEGILATGANQLQTIWYGVVPQVVLPYISFTIYRWDINVRMATIIGFAGGGGIGTILYQYSMRSQWAEVGCLIVVIASVVWILDVLSAYVREALK